MKVKGERSLAKKWARRVKKAAGSYADGVANSRSARWRLDPTSGRKWARSTASKASNWAKGWAPYRRVLQNIVLPPRGPLRSPENFERWSLIATALHEEKMRRQKKAR